MSKPQRALSVQQIEAILRRHSAGVAPANIASMARALHAEMRLPAGAIALDVEVTRHLERDLDMDRYHGTLRINGVGMRLTAPPVVSDADGMQQGVGVWYGEVEAMRVIDDVHAFETRTIEGRDYVLVATPYED